MKQKLLKNKIFRRKQRARAKLFGSAKIPRLSVFRSNCYTYGQLIDDENGQTLFSFSTKEIKKLKNEKGTKIILAGMLGEIIAKQAIEKGIEKAVFDRGSYKYFGRVKAVAEGARKAGLKF